MKDIEFEHKLQLNFLNANLRKYGFFLGMVAWLFKGFLRAASFSVQSVLRYGIGRASFGVITIFFSFLWVNFFVLSDLDYTFDSDEYYYSLDEPDELDRKLMPLFGAWSCLKKFGNDVALIDDAILKGPMDDGSKAAYYFSFVVLALGAFNKLYEQFVEEKHKPNIDFRGKSILLYWVKKKHIKVPLDLLVFQRLIEPIVVSLIGVTLLMTDLDSNFAWMLILGAIALFVEEKKAFDRERIYNDPNRRQGTLSGNP